MKKTREQLLREINAITCRASIHAEVDLATLRTGDGVAVTPALRDELLAANAAGKYVALEFSVLAYEQKPGEDNRNFVRFRDGAMRALGRSFRGMPFLRDHLQDDQLARGGTITESNTEDLGDGHYQIKMTVLATAPWLVDALLRGLVTTFSIGWSPTGDVMCSAHDAPIFTKCYCLPGDRLEERTGDDGEKRMVRSRAGAVRASWIYTSADGVELSTVSVPAVPSVHVIEGIRAAMSALNSGGAIHALADNNGGELPHEDDMNLFKALIPILALAATASEEEVLKAVKDKAAALEAAEAKLAIAETERAKLATEVAGHRAAADKAEQDKAIRSALDAGQIAQSEESMWRRLYVADRVGFEAELAKRAPGSATPVGAPRQHEKPQPPASTGTEAAVNQVLAANGVNAPLALKLARGFGAKDPVKTIASAIGIKEA